MHDLVADLKVSTQTFEPDHGKKGSGFIFLPANGVEYMMNIKK